MSGQKMYDLELLRASEGTLSWSRMHLQSLAPTNGDHVVMARSPYV
jgi:hypothetical protein